MSRANTRSSRALHRATAAPLLEQKERLLRAGFIAQARLDESEEAADVLRRLLAAHPELAGETEGIARLLLQGESFKAIADELEEAVQALDTDDLNARAGAHEWGYVEPSEAAWEILEEAVEPFVADIERRIALGLEDAALQLCQSMVLGLYRVERGKGRKTAASVGMRDVRAQGSFEDSFVFPYGELGRVGQAGDFRHLSALPPEKIGYAASRSALQRRGLRLHGEDT